jgi:prepilin-type N-terminal cleavage/methylation domain-containing protein
MRTRNDKQAGFTLVEIAIVLVIIGLLLGGILKGQEMIVQAKIKNSISDFNGILAAYNGYIDRYRALPGDDMGATRWGANATLPGAGGGNSIIQGVFSSTADTDESRLFWQHLRLAGFVPGSGTNQPVNAHNGIVGVQTGNGPAMGATPTVTQVFASGTPAIGLGGVLICSSLMPDKVAIAVDNQTDDGSAIAGQVRAVADPNPRPSPPATATLAYAETGSNTYVVCRAI